MASSSTSPSTAGLVDDGTLGIAAGVGSSRWRSFLWRSPSLDPAFVGRRVEARVTDSEVLAVALDSGELVCRHERSFARHRTITALEHARALRQRRGEAAEPVVEVRPLDRYDALIA